MAQDTAIEWCDDTVNPWWGCQKVSEACKNCYAEAWDARFGGDHWGPGTERLLRVEKAIGELRRIERRAKKEGQPRRVFIASMADVFEDRPDLVEPRRKLWEALHALSGWVVPLILTKRPDVMAAWAKEHGWPKHAWAGYTVESQKRADWGIPYLLDVPAPVRFLSMEPLLGIVNINAALFQQPPPSPNVWDDDGEGPEVGGMWRGPTRLGTRGVSWVISGGESGRKARPSHPDWHRAVRDQCAAAGVPYLFKQWGAWRPATPPGDVDVVADGAAWACLHANGVHADIDSQQDADAVWLERVGKKNAGRTLDGVEHNGVPDVAVPA